MRHESENDRDLENRDASLLDTVDEHPLHVGHVLHQPGHDVSGRAVVEPGQGELLDPCVEIAPEVKDHALLEVVVEKDAQRIEQIPGKESSQARKDERHQFLCVMLP